MSGKSNRRMLSVCVFITMFLCVIFSSFLFQIGVKAQTPYKLTLSPSMVTNESGIGDATALVDEQLLAGDPPDGSCSTYWFAGWDGSQYPVSASIDLGQNYVITKIYLRDINDIGNFIVSTGTPGNWIELFTDGLENYHVWNEHEVDVTTRYIRCTMEYYRSNVAEIVIYGYPAGGDPTPPSEPTVTPVPSPPAGTGWITREVWDNIEGTSINDLTGNENYPDNPSGMGLLSSFEAPANVADNYGQRMHGYIHPPVSGNYEFWIAGDDHSELWLSSDENPSNVHLIASVPEWTNPREWTKFTQQYSGDIGLEAGETYYVMALMKEGYGGDNLAVAWKIPGESREIISGNYLSPANDIIPTPTPKPTPEPGSVTVADFMGINAFIDDPVEKMLPVGHVREYHNWNWDEGDEPWASDGTYPGYPYNQNKFNPSYAGGGWNFDHYYRDVTEAGLTVFPAVQGSVYWLTGSRTQDKPISPGESSTNPASYAEHADHMFQYAARYGGTAVDHSLLKLASDQQALSGLGYIQYYENWNEPDKNWEGPNAQFSPQELAAMTSADYDGHEGTMGSTFGVKNADPNAKLVMGGLYKLDLQYISDMKTWFEENRDDGKFAADVLNFHHYCCVWGSYGISPEEDGLKSKLADLVSYRDQYLPGKEIWLTEFGWDTHSSSPQRAVAHAEFNIYEVQAQWILRGYLAGLGAGIDRMTQYMLRDVNPNSNIQYDSSGLVGPKGDWSPKPSWYYVYTMKNRLGNFVFAGEQASGHPNVMVYKFIDPDSDNGAYVLWCPTSNGTTVNEYNLSLGSSPSNATQITMQDQDIDGIETSLNIQNGVVTVNISETPIFVMVDNIQ